jgi:hypothetical protein
VRAVTREVTTEEITQDKSEESLGVVSCYGGRRHFILLAPPIFSLSPSPSLKHALYTGSAPLVAYDTQVQYGADAKWFHLQAHLRRTGWQ